MATNFEQLSENLFKTLQKQLDLLSERAPDLDVDFQDNNVLTITFEDDSQIVINKHQSNQDLDSGEIRRLSLSLGRAKK